MGWKHVIVIVAALATVVLLYILPTPNTQFRTVEITAPAASSNKELSSSEKIDEALKLIQGGGAPMQGILLLKEVVENDPNNELALFYLGDFSLQTKQYSKAIPRFLKLTEIKPNNPQNWLLLGQAYALNKNNQEAITAYKKFITFDTDSIIIEDVRKRIEKLK